MLYFCQISIKSLTVCAVYCINICDSRKTCEGFCFLVLPLESNLLAVVRVTNHVYALYRPSSVDVGVEKDSVVRGF